ncbi:nucleoside/nucleotide kinase family protein [Nocardioides marmoraquaticus]
MLREDDLQCVRAEKFSERPHRGEGDDIVNVARIEDGECDLIYVINDTYYGVDTKSIQQQLDEGLNTFIVLSDFRVVEQLKNRFGSQATTVYISAPMSETRVQQVMADRHKSEFRPTEEQSSMLRRQFYRLQCAAQLNRWLNVFDGMVDLLGDWSEVVPRAETTRIRAEKVRSFHLKYIQGLTLFDHVVLNYGGPEDMTRQMRQIVSSTPGMRPDQGPVLMVIAAASGAGKGSVMETVKRVFGDRVEIVEKQALRAPKPNDGRDGMRALGVDGTFSEDFDFRWSFHESGTPYAISTARVRAALERGVSAVVISNIAVFPQFLERFPGRVVFVYLHATRPEADVREFQYQNNSTAVEAEERIREIRQVHENYMDHINEFDHVLLNTSFKEDLYDQMFGVIQRYAPTAADAPALT